VGTRSKASTATPAGTQGQLKSFFGGGGQTGGGKATAKSKSKDKTKPKKSGDGSGEEYEIKTVLSRKVVCQTLAENVSYSSTKQVYGPLPNQFGAVDGYKYKVQWSGENPKTKRP
jgi:hypothetical protein